MTGQSAAGAAYGLAKKMLARDFGEQRWVDADTAWDESGPAGLTEFYTRQIGVEAQILARAVVSTAEYAWCAGDCSSSLAEIRVLKRVLTALNVPEFDPAMLDDDLPPVADRPVSQGYDT